MQDVEKLFQLIKRLITGEVININNFVVEYCDDLLDGNIYFPRNFSGIIYKKESKKCNIENFNWDIKFQIAPTACQLFLQSFFPIKYLIHGYNISSNNDYLNLASELIKSWLKYEPNSKNRMTWYDHSTSERVIIMVYFILTIKKSNIVSYNNLINQINDSITKHGEFLYDDKNYTPNNHGTMINKALYITSIYLNNTKYREKSIDRLKNELKRNFSDKMVYLENSFHYHLFALELFSIIERTILNPFGDTLGEQLSRSSIEKSIDFLIQGSKPDLNFPMFGDSLRKSSLRDINSFYPNERDYPPLEWALTSGKSGKNPEELFKVYQKEGYAFFRNSWDLTKLKEITYASFKSGFFEKAHKHADDLSFTLFSKGQDIFVDSGTYTYEAGDHRKFFMSTLAHNTVVVDDETYPFLTGNNEDTGIIDYGDEKYYSYVIGKNDMYHGVNITRSLYFLKHGGLVIVDDIQSEDIHDYSQYYHLSSKIDISDIIKLEGNDTLIKIFDKNIEINILQIEHCDTKFIKGNKNNAGPGIISEDFEDLKETTSLKFSINAKKTRFITFITINELNKKRDKQCYNNSTILKYGSNKELVIIEPEREIKIRLKDYSRKISQYLRVEKNKRNQFIFTITAVNADELFAWYIIKNGERIDVIWYDSTPVLNYIFTEPGKYQIKYFIKKDEKVKMYRSPIITITDEDIIYPLN